MKIENVSSKPYIAIASILIRACQLLHTPGSKLHVEETENSKRDELCCDVSYDEDASTEWRGEMCWALFSLGINSKIYEVGYPEESDMPRSDMKSFTAQ